MLIQDFSASSFISDAADGKNCVTSRCASVGQVQFVKVYCNSTDMSVQGVCGKYGFIYCIPSSMDPITLEENLKKKQ